jgi:hypothetical protein
MSRAPTPKHSSTTRNARYSTGSSTWAGHLERFKDIDTRRGWRDDSPVERFGEKYQWIGFYEVLRRITDNRDLSPSRDSEQPQPCRHPQQIVWRNIDPTVLARRTSSPSPGRPWFPPAQARFPEAVGQGRLALLR